MKLKKTSMYFTNLAPHPSSLENVAPDPEAIFAIYFLSLSFSLTIC
jgi:hypothetical protein